MTYTNNTRRDASQVTSEYSLGIDSNYALVQDEPSEVIYDNLTTAVDSRELLSFRFRKIGQVNSDLPIAYPYPVKSGIQYAVQLEETVSGELNGERVDAPVVMYLTVRHPVASFITNEVVAETFERLISALRRDSDNSYKFNALMRGALRQ